MGAVRDVSVDGIARMGVAGFVVDIFGGRTRVLSWSWSTFKLSKTRWWRKFEKGASARVLGGTSFWVMWRIFGSFLDLDG